MKNRCTQCHGDRLVQNPPKKRFLRKLALFFDLANDGRNQKTPRAMAGVRLQKNEVIALRDWILKGLTNQEGEATLSAKEIKSILKDYLRNKPAPYFYLSNKVFDTMEFSGMYEDAGALVMDVNYSAVNKLVGQINKKYQLNLSDRKEAHITVLTPPEYLSELHSEGKGLDRLLTMSEIHSFARNIIQDSSFSIKCVGSVTKGDKQAFYLVVESDDLLNIRKHIQMRATIRGQTRGLKNFFDAKDWHPHITIGYVGDDIHSLKKDHSTCVESPGLKIVL